MRYLLLVWIDEVAESAEPPRGAVGAWIDDVQGRGLRLIGGPLGPTSASTVVRERGGELLVTDGPFAESREWIGGFDVLECRDFDEAVRAARQHPMVGLGTIELRPIGSLGVPGEERVLAGSVTS